MKYGQENSIRHGQRFRSRQNQSLNQQGVKIFAVATLGDQQNQSRKSPRNQQSVEVVLTSYELGRTVSPHQRIVPQSSRKALVMFNVDLQVILVCIVGRRRSYLTSTLAGEPSLQRNVDKEASWTGLPQMDSLSSNKNGYTKKTDSVNLKYQKQVLYQ